MDLPTNKIVFSGLQPSGVIHLGNYLGAIKQWLALQVNNTAYYCVVDQHAITVDYNPAELPTRILDTVAMYLAAGLDPAKSIIFIQSDVPAHTELAWLLATQTPFGELTRMTQFKDKAAKQNLASLGLFAYPVLMAADILLYQTNVVPVGEDQVQHLELTRDLAKRFNNKFGKIFSVPEPFLNPDSARIMSLADPARKMSKTDEPKSFLALTDPPEVIRQKIMSAVTDTKPTFSFTSSGPSILNLLRIYQGCSGQSAAAIEQQFAGQGYQSFKTALADRVIQELAPLQKSYQAIRPDEKHLSQILADGAARASAAAQTTLAAAKKALGLSR